MPPVDFEETLKSSDLRNAALRSVQRALATLQLLRGEESVLQRFDLGCALDSLEMGDYAQACVCAECAITSREGALSHSPTTMSLDHLANRLSLLTRILHAVARDPRRRNGF